MALGLVAVLLGQTWFLRGLVLPMHLGSGSMAPALLGPHRRVVCENCGHRFVCGSDGPAVPPTVTCPNCGNPGNKLASLPETSGDRVMMDRGVCRVLTPHRWDVVALRDPRSPRRIVVKRVVGLPGESVQVLRGDVYVNGRIQRKPMPLQRAMAVLVYDADHPGHHTESSSPRWRADGVAVPWASVDGRFAHPEQPGQETADWLAYHHAECVSGRWVPGAVKDESVYNASWLRRVEDVSQVSDLLVSFRVVRTFGRGQLVVRIGQGSNAFDVWMDPTRNRFEVKQGGHDIPVAEGTLPQSDRGVEVEVSLFDAELTVALAGRVAAEVPFELLQPSRASDRPLAIGARGLGVEIRHLRVYRDVYYTRPIGPQARWGLDQPVLLGEGEYYVLGDNSPISEDSRTWPDGPAVKAEWLVGRPLIVLLPTRPAALGPWQIQVPDPARMRYIR